MFRTYNTRLGRFTFKNFKNLQKKNPAPSHLFFPHSNLTIDCANLSRFGMGTTVILGINRDMAMCGLCVGDVMAMEFTLLLKLSHICFLNSIFCVALCQCYKYYVVAFGFLLMGSFV